MNAYDTVDNNRESGNLEIVVKYERGQKTVYAQKGDNLLSLLVKEQIYIESPCGGKGTCGKCRVTVIEGLTDVSDADRRHLTDEDIKRGVRLACSINLRNTIKVEIENEESKMNVLTSGLDGDIEVLLGVKKQYIAMDEPSIEDQRSDIKRLKDGLGVQELNVDNKVLREIPEKFRNSSFKVTASLYNNTLLDIEKGDTRDKIYGAAVDIGTTTIACYLINLNNGDLIDIESGINNQRAYGADVISRINYTMEQEEGLSVLKDSITGQITEMLSKLCTRNDMKMKNVYNVTIAGNTTMTHLFLGIPCRNISLSPYIPVTTDVYEIKGSEINIPICGYVSVLPGVSGYIGSDITAGILACGMYKHDKHSLLLDLGTNGEIALGNKDGIITCSTAAGPAFEGANIKHGIGGIKGAISKINLSKDKIYQTIGGAKPIGICGSGVLDMVSELLKYSIIDETGRMADEDEITLQGSLKGRLSIDGNMKQFAIDNDIVFTQKDVREVQLAKAAIHAGITILLKEKGIGCSDVENVYIAGGFGNFMDIDSAFGIGILPEEFRGKVKSIGNSAGIGAKMCLLSLKYKNELDEIIEKTKYIELSGRQDFQDYYVDSMMFGGI